MKKKFHKIAQQGLNLKDYGSTDFISYYSYPPAIINVHKVPPVFIQQGVPIIWKPRIMHDKYSQLMPPIVLKIASSYIGRFIAALSPSGS